MHTPDIICVRFAGERRKKCSAHRPETFEKVQQKRGKVHNKKRKDSEHNMFSGLLVCSDCGSNLRFRFNQGNRDIRYFNCSNNNSRKRTCPTTHYIRVDYLEEIVLTDIRRLIAFTNQYRDEFVDLIERNSGVGPSGDNGFDQTTNKTKYLRHMRAFFLHGSHRI